MRNILIVAFVMVILSAAGTFLYIKNASSETPEEEPMVVKPWVEIVSSRAFIIDTATGSHLRELKTGDEVSQGTKIETPKNALVNIYFPDGSVARIDGESTVIIETADYDAASQKLVVRMSLAAGRVWSKIIGLATPDSIWEVKTSNAVATVRGTAFGMEYIRGKSTVIGSENKVTVRPVDPVTHRTIESAEIVIEPDTFVAFSNDEIDEIESGKKIFKADLAPESLLDDEWIKRAKKADEVIEKKLEDARSRNKNEVEAKTEFRTIIQKEFTNDIQKQREERLPTMPTGRQAEQASLPVSEASAPVNKVSDTPNTEIKSEPVTESTPQSLSIVAKTRLVDLIEETEVPLEAVLVLSDGTTRTVTGEVAWNVVGNIGTVRQNIFMPHLDESVAEFGSAVGAIVATWKDPKTGQTVIGKTPLFTVHLKVPDTLETEG